jgi:hypothetical protein
MINKNRQQQQRIEHNGMDGPADSEENDPHHGGLESRCGRNRSIYTMQSNKTSKTREQREAAHGGPGL